MSDFAADWLALREPADAAARASDLVERLGWHEARPRTMVDWAAGTGANMRYLAPRVAGSQHWRLLDHDAALLGRVGACTSALAAVDGSAVSWQIEVRDLVAFDADCFAGADLVTASALLDLVGSSWLAAWINGVREFQVPVLVALSYDGRLAWQPAESGDADIQRAFNAHQRQQSPFGEPALGWAAPDMAETLLRQVGYTVLRSSSDWLLGPDQRPLLEELISGWSAAAAEQEPDSANAFAAWAERRREQAQAGRLSARVGHSDILGQP